MADLAGWTSNMDSNTASRMLLSPRVPAKSARLSLLVQTNSSSNHYHSFTKSEVYDKRNQEMVQNCLTDCAMH